MIRSKYTNILNELVLNPILDLVEVYVDNDTGLLHFRGEEGAQTVKNTLTNRSFVYITTEEHMVFYKQHREDCEVFNPFLKYKNALHLLLMLSPILYMRYCRSYNPDKEEDLVCGILDDDIALSMEEIAPYVNILQYPKTKEGETEYAVELKKDIDGEVTERLSAKNENNITAIMLLLLRIMEFLDETPEVFKEYKTEEEFVEFFEETMEKYIKEKETNNKHFKKLVSQDEDDIDYSGSDEDQKLEEESEDDKNILDENTSDAIRVTDVLEVSQFVENEPDSFYEELDFS